MTPLERASKALIDHLEEDGWIGVDELRVSHVTPAVRAALVTLREPSIAMLASESSASSALGIRQAMIDAATASNDL